MGKRRVSCPWKTVSVSLISWACLVVASSKSSLLPSFALPLLIQLTCKLHLSVKTRTIPTTYTHGQLSILLGIYVAVRFFQSGTSNNERPSLFPFLPPYRGLVALCGRICPKCLKEAVQGTGISREMSSCWVD